MISILGSNMPPISTYSGAGALSGRLCVPVAESQALYAQFEHVYGVPTEGGVAIDRVKILNTLIDGLSSLRDKPAHANSGDFAAQPPERLDALIEKYRKEIKSAISAAGSPYRPQPSLPNAIAVDILV
jgi:hypothetical protein